MAFFIKAVAVLFFIYLTVDSVFKIRKIKADLEEELVSPKLAANLHRRHARNVVVFGILALIVLVTFFMKIGFLGE